MTPTNSPPKRPGPVVAATAVISFNLILAFLRACSTNRSITSECALAANSGTTPPKDSWTSI